MTTMTTQVTMPTDQELALTRVLDAPPAMVYKAWTDPALMARW